MDSKSQPNGTKAIQRILRDLREIHQEPFDFIKVHVNENNIFEWHIALSAPAIGEHYLMKHPYAGTKFHLVMKFTYKYPMDPPSIELSTPIPHPNVCGKYICLDMLRKKYPNYNQRARGTKSDDEHYTGGWSCAYSAFSILMQLQSFLFDTSVPQEGWDGKTFYYENQLSYSDVKHSKDAARAFMCRKCHFNMTSPLSNDSVLPPKCAYIGGPRIVNIPPEVICKIFDYVPSHKDLAALSRACNFFRQVISRFHVITRKELLCYYTKKMFTEDIMGVGIHVERHPDGYGIKNITSPFELLSKEAFHEDGVRESVWGERFEYWMPLLLNGQHGRRALPLIQNAIVTISRGSLQEAPAFNPLMVLELFPKLMNNMIVNLVKEDTSSGALMMSETALKGYCSFHHILLQFASQYPILQQRAEYWLGEFMSHPSRRVKMVISDLGELLVLLCLSSKHTWDSIATEFLSECFDRNVLWILDKQSGDCPELAYLESYPVSEYRNQVTFKATLVSRRLLMFQVAFLKLVGRPKGKRLQDILDQYRSSYGMPSQAAINALHKTCKDIFMVDTWKEFYQMLGLNPPSAAEITYTLRASVRRSEEKGYHCNRTKVEDLIQWRKTVDPEFVTKGTEPLPAPQTQPADFVYKVALRNLPWKIQPAEVKSICSQFGRVTALDVQQGYGAVFYEDRASAETAAKYLNGLGLLGRSIQTREPVQLRANSQSERVPTKSYSQVAK